MLFFFDMASIFEHVDFFFCHRWAKFAAHNDVCPPTFRSIISYFAAFSCGTLYPLEGRGGTNYFYFWIQNTYLVLHVDEHG